mmetsp:Transcript_8273/g.14801  ORF Transcript_8273/g.14801 Transcript_8273/m.14801 type:complete len:220 (-) Transcript_8273:337-996(-)
MANSTSSTSRSWPTHCGKPARSVTLWRWSPPASNPSCASTAGSWRHCGSRSTACPSRRHSSGPCSTRSTAGSWWNGGGSCTSTRTSSCKGTSTTCSACGRGPAPAQSAARGWTSTRGSSPCGPPPRTSTCSCTSSPACRRSRWGGRPCPTPPAAARKRSPSPPPSGACRRSPGRASTSRSSPCCSGSSPRSARPTPALWTGSSTTACCSLWPAASGCRP